MKPQRAVRHATPPHKYIRRWGRSPPRPVARQTTDDGPSKDLAAAQTVGPNRRDRKKSSSMDPAVRSQRGRNNLLEDPAYAAVLARNLRGRLMSVDGGHRGSRCAPAMWTRPPGVREINLPDQLSARRNRRREPPESSDYCRSASAPVVRTGTPGAGGTTSAAMVRRGVNRKLTRANSIRKPDPPVAVQRHRDRGAPCPGNLPLPPWPGPPHPAAETPRPPQGSR